MKSLWKIIFVIAIIVLIASIISDAQNFDWRQYTYEPVRVEDESIKIGFISPLTNIGVTAGERSLIAARLAVDEINQAGGINGRAVRLINEDGECSENARQAAQRLIDQGVVGIVGGLCSTETLSFIDLIDQYQVPTISYCASNPELSGSSDYFFRTFPSDIFQAEYAANYIAETLQHEGVALVYLNDRWGSGIAQEFRSNFEGDILLDYSFEAEHEDFTELWVQIEELQPDLVYFLSFDKHTILAFNQIDEFNISSDFFGADGWDDPEIWTRVGTERTFLYTTPKLKQDQEFFDTIRTRGIFEASNCYSQAYDTVNIFAEALRQDQDGSLIDELQDISYETPVSYFDSIEFNELGDLVSTDYVVESVVSGPLLVE